MRAITMVPGQQGSVAFADKPEPPPADGRVLVQTAAIGICGTDVEIIEGAYGWRRFPGRSVRPFARRNLRRNWIRSLLRVCQVRCLNDSLPETIDLVPRHATLVWRPSCGSSSLMIFGRNSMRIARWPSDITTPRLPAETSNTTSADATPGG